MVLRCVAAARQRDASETDREMARIRVENRY
jgi:hypothetical protein